ncbi:MAG: M23 family metallopeptidase [Saprospiraceae bacterium]|nr:M23 family metallopeptidase [Saprospiraceae bacterium]
MKMFSTLLATVLLVSCQTSKYSLPFPKGQQYQLLQTWNGPWGHQDKTAYAYDFNMPLGSVITAARDGKVIKIEEQYTDGNRTPGQENYVFIEHKDGTFSRYYHLTQNGVLVAVGDTVGAGDTIALSGNTGASAGPHLHFDITKECPDWGCQTIPFKFKEIKDSPLQLKTAYRSKYVVF